MTEYRVCLFDHFGFGNRSLIIECANDTEARAVGADALKDAAIVEVWDGGRSVGEFSTHGLASKKAAPRISVAATRVIASHPARSGTLSWKISAATARGEFG